MPVLLSLDFETTGLDCENDRITEVGAVLWSTNFNRAMETASYFVQTDKPVSKEVTDLTGINNAMLKKFGYSEEEAIDSLIDLAEQSNAYIGQNVVEFDKIFLENAAKRLGRKAPERLWIDTRTDLPGVESKTLSYMACDAGFLNPFPHNAVADCLTVLRLLSKYIELGKFTMDDVIARAKQPNVVVQAFQDRAHNADAKKLKFLWKPEFKMWVKVVKECDVDDLAKAAPFNIAIQKELTPQQVWYS